MTAGRGGSLTVVGSGIRVVAQVTAEARARIEAADEVLYGTDAVTARWLKHLNPAAENLDRLHQPGEARPATYRRTVARIVAGVRAGRAVCVVFYGHPGVFVHAGHAAIRQVRQEGYPARMLAGISAEDCLLADFGPAAAWPGRQGFEATDFLVRRRPFDPTVPLFLWQAGLLGRLDFQSRANPAGLRRLAAVLVAAYGSDWPTHAYLAPQFPVVRAAIQTFPLSRLPEADLSPFTTLYLPPRAISTPSGPLTGPPLDDGWAEPPPEADR